MDFSNQYPADCLPPEGEYESRDALFTAIKAWAAPRGYTFRIGRSTKEHSKKHTVTFTCNRARPPPSEAKPRVRLTSSRGTGCQFSVLGKESYDSTRWFLKHRIGSQFAVHNHEPNVGLAAYLVPRRAPAPSPAPGDAPGASERAAAPLGAPRTAPASAVDYAAMATPEACYADFCLIPVGTGSVSVAEEVAAVQRVLRASGLKYTMHAAGTTVEGRWDDVMAAVGKAHTAVHARGVVRVQSSMRVGSRTDKTQTAEEKVRRVRELLAADEG